MEGSQLKPDYHAEDADVYRFRTARWSALLLSPQKQASASRAAVAKLCNFYWHPVEIDDEIHAHCEALIASGGLLSP